MVWGLSLQWHGFPSCGCQAYLLHGGWDPSSLTWDQTHIPCIIKADSQPLDHPGKSQVTEVFTEKVDTCSFAVEGRCNLGERHTTQSDEKMCPRPHDKPVLSKGSAAAYRNTATVLYLENRFLLPPLNPHFHQKVGIGLVV